MGILRGEVGGKVLEGNRGENENLGWSYSE